MSYSIISRTKGNVCKISDTTHLKAMFECNLGVCRACNSMLMSSHSLRSVVNKCEKKPELILNLLSLDISEGGVLFIENDDIPCHHPTMHLSDAVINKCDTCGNLTNVLHRQTAMSEDLKLSQNQIVNNFNKIIRLDVCTSCMEIQEQVNS
jgi:hypothetical protein